MSSIPSPFLRFRVPRPGRLGPPCRTFPVACDKRAHTPDPYTGLAAPAESAVTVRDLFVVDHPLIIQTDIREAAAAALVEREVVPYRVHGWQAGLVALTQPHSSHEILDQAYPDN